MELWVRSQDKEKLLKCDDIAIKQHRYDTLTDEGNRCIHYEGYEIVGYFDKNTEYEILGIYATKERALEVLDEIQGRISKNECLKSMMPKVTDIRGYEEQFGQLFKDIIYQMPEE